MTCIVGLEHNGHVIIGGDSAGVAGLDIHTRIDEKVFRNDEFVIGFTSSFRMGQLLRYSFTPPEHSSKKDDMKYLVTDFMDGVRETFKEKGFLGKEKEAETGGTFLLGYRKKLYIIDNDFQVGKTHDGFGACGCGSALALGSLYSTKHINDPIERLRLSLEAAAHFSAGVKGPFNFISTEHIDYIKV